MIPDDFDPSEDLTMPEQHGIKALAVNNAYIFTASLFDALSPLSGDLKITRANKPDGSFPYDLNDPELGVPVTGVRMALGPDFVAVGSLTAQDPPDGNVPPRIFVVKDIFTVTPSLYQGDFQAKPGAELYSLAGLVGPAQSGVFWFYSDPIYGPLYLSQSGMSELPGALFPTDPFPDRPDAMVADQLNLYLGDRQGHLYRCPLPCPTQSDSALELVGVTIGGGSEPIIALAADGIHVYALSAGNPGNLYIADALAPGQTLSHYGPAGDTRADAADLILTTPYALAVDERYLFFTNADGMRFAPKSGAVPPPIYPLDGTNFGTPRSVTIDETYVYWGTLTANGVDGRVRRARKKYAP